MQKIAHESTLSFFKDGRHIQGLKYFFLYSGLTLNELLLSLEEDENDLSVLNEVDIAILPPTNACQDLTDEDSGDEDMMTVNNLPGSQLRSEAELMNSSQENVDDGYDEDDYIPLSLLKASGQKHFKWVEKDLDPKTVIWPMVFDVKANFSPTQLFFQLFDEDIISMFVEFSNNYARKKNKTGNISNQEMKSFFGILLLSGYVPLPRRRMFWECSSDTRNELVANALSRDRFEFILSNLHCCDNDNLDKEDRFAKVRPLFDKLNTNFQNFAPSMENHSVDESMVPYFGKHGCKQFIKGKPIRYGYKMWMGATSNGYCVWLEPYQGAKTKICPNYKPFGLGPSIILQYSDVLSRLGQLPYHIFFDNFFTTVPLLHQLQSRGIRGTGTIRENRMSKCPILSKSDMKKKNRGDCDYRSCDNKVVIVKWHDNNAVNVASNNVPVEPFHQVSRYSQKEKKRITVNQPHNVYLYNSFMGGVDRCDQNVSLYRTSIRGKKWYFCLIAYGLDIAEQNAWQLHRLQSPNGPEKLDHLTFRRQIALHLLESNKNSKKRGRPSSLENVETRFDNQEHYLIRQEKQTRCRICHKKVQKKCFKCNVALHMECFQNYHTNV